MDYKNLTLGLKSAYILLKINENRIKSK